MKLSPVERDILHRLVSVEYKRVRSKEVAYSNMPGRNAHEQARLESIKAEMEIVCGLLAKL